MLAITKASEFQRLEIYRLNLFAEIHRAMEVFHHWKPYEGEIAIRMPGANKSVLDEWVIVVRCYVASTDGETAFTYRGQSLDECLGNAENDLALWIADTDEYIRQKQLAE